jgi:hypothetical protein
MPYVGFSGVADQANTSDGFAQRTSAKNNPADSVFGDDVGDGGVVDLYHNGAPVVISYIAMESTGYVLQEDSSKIQLEVG